MQRESLSVVFPVRLTPSLKQALEFEADRLRLRPSDVARMALAERLRNAPSPVREVEVQNDEQR